MIVEAITTFILSLIFSVTTQQAVEGPFFIIGMLLSKVLLFFLIIIIRNFTNKETHQTSWKKTLAVLIIPASTIIVMALQYNYFIKMQEYTTSDTVLTLLCFTFLLAANFIVFELINQIYQDAEKDKQLTVANKLIRSQNDNYQQLLQYNRDIQKIRHDYKNFLIGVLSDLKHNNYEILEHTLTQECHKLNMLAQAENNLNIIDYIVSSKTEQTLAHNIKIDYTSSNLNNIQISSIDLAILIGNAIDNAIEAVNKLKNEPDKQIWIFAKRHKNNIIISIKNKVSENIDTKHLATTKKDSLNHGFGLPEIRNLVAKYHGTVCFTCENKLFEVHMVLSNSCDE